MTRGKEGIKVSNEATNTVESNFEFKHFIDIKLKLKQLFDWLIDSVCVKVFYR